VRFLARHRLDRERADLQRSSGTDLLRAACLRGPLPSLVKAKSRSASGVYQQTGFPTTPRQPALRKTAVRVARHGWCMSTSTDIGGAPGSVRRRGDVPAPVAYAVFDCETTGTTPGLDEIVSLAAVRLDADGVETARYARLVRPSRPIPAEATTVHGISAADVVSAPPFDAIAREVYDLLDGTVFVAHNAPFDLAMLKRAFALTGIDYNPVGVACTLDAFRLLEPLAGDHRLQSICDRHGIAFEDAHEALGDALAATALLRMLLDQGVAPETVELDQAAFLRLRARGDTRPASERQISRVFGMARSAGLLDLGGCVDRRQVVALVQRACGTGDVDSLTREQVQEVYDALERATAMLPVNPCRMTLRGAFRGSRLVG
jgi:DNA polymerase III epsilon subunit family exonuclease